MKPARTPTHPLAHLDPARRERLLALPGNEVWREQLAAGARGARSAKNGGREVLVNAHRDGDVVTVIAKGMRLVNELNESEHYQAKGRRAAGERGSILEALLPIPRPDPPLFVLITREGPRRMDNDGATASAKHVRDGVADWLGIDDGREDLVRYRVVQARGPYLVRVTIRRGGTDA